MHRHALYYFVGRDDTNQYPLNTPRLTRANKRIADHLLILNADNTDPWQCHFLAAALRANDF